MRIAARVHVSRSGARSPSISRNHDRHGRGPRSPLLFPSAPGWNTRKQEFFTLVENVLSRFTSNVPDVATIEFGIEEAPPSSPAEWESHEVTMARAFPRDRRRGLADRIVLYRLPIQRTMPAEEVPEAVAYLLADRICEVLAVSPEELFFR